VNHTARWGAASLLADDTTKAGERVTVTGNATHTGSARMFFVSLQREDGSELMLPGPQRRESIEQDRRRCSEQRKQQERLQ
jgi:hypothetical protein